MTKPVRYSMFDSHKIYVKTPIDFLSERAIALKDLKTTIRQ